MRRLASLAIAALAPLPPLARAIQEEVKIGYSSFGLGTDEPSGSADLARQGAGPDAGATTLLEPAGERAAIADTYLPLGSAAVPPTDLGAGDPASAYLPPTVPLASPTLAGAAAATAWRGAPSAGDPDGFYTPPSSHLASPGLFDGDAAAATPQAPGAGGPAGVYFPPAPLASPSLAGDAAAANPPDVGAGDFVGTYMPPLVLVPAASVSATADAAGASPTVGPPMVGSPEGETEQAVASEVTTSQPAGFAGRGSRSRMPGAMPADALPPSPRRGKSIDESQPPADARVAEPRGDVFVDALPWQPLGGNRSRAQERLREVNRQRVQRTKGIQKKLDTRQGWPGAVASGGGSGFTVKIIIAAVAIVLLVVGLALQAIGLDACRDCFGAASSAKMCEAHGRSQARPLYHASQPSLLQAASSRQDRHSSGMVLRASLSPERSALAQNGPHRLARTNRRISFDPRIAGLPSSDSTIAALDAGPPHLRAQMQFPPPQRIRAAAPPPGPLFGPPVDMFVAPTAATSRAPAAEQSSGLVSPRGGLVGMGAFGGTWTNLNDVPPQSDA